MMFENLIKGRNYAINIQPLFYGYSKHLLILSDTCRLILCIFKEKIGALD